MKYKTGYKYQLVVDEVRYTIVCPPVAIATEYITIDTDGLLYIRKGYAWDGPSGPTVDTDTNMRASLFHDAIYQLIRMGELPHHYWKIADKEFDNIAKEDGMSKFRRWYYLRALKLAKGTAAKAENKKKVYTVGK